MPTQHLYPPQHLALAVALVLGFADISLAQPPADLSTTAAQKERLEAIANAADTKRTHAKKPRKGDAIWNKSNDLVIISAGGKFPGVLDGGGGANVLRLDAAKYPHLDKAINFEALHVTSGNWTHTGDFDGWSVIEPDTTLLNTGRIQGQVGVLGGFDNQGTVTHGVAIESGARMTNSGTVSGRVDVHEKAWFGGNGTVGDLHVAGQLEVGPTTGAPSVMRDFSLSETAVLVYGLNPAGDSATINVEGTAALKNATLKIDAAPGEYLDSREHTVIKASRVEGEFGNVVNELAYMTATPRYEATQVNLIYARNDVPLDAAATSDNGREFAANAREPQAIPAPEPKSVQTPAVAQAPDDKTRVPVPIPKPAEPPIKAPAAQVAVRQPRAAQPVAKPNAAITALLGSNRIVAADAIDQLTGSPTADLANATLNSIAPISTGMLSAMGRQTPGSASPDGQVWVQAIGNSGVVGRQWESEALKHSTKGLMLGTDWAVSPEWRLGIIGSKTQTRLDGYRFDGELDSWYLGAYALRQGGPWALRLGAVYGDHDGSTKRHVAFNGFTDRLKGRYDANTQQVFGQIGYNLGSAPLVVEPYALLGYQRYERDRYTEKGGDAALKVDGQTQDYYNSTLGLRLARVFALDQGVQLTPRLNVGWKHIYGDVTGSARQSLVAGGDAYTVEGTELDRDSLLLEAGLDLTVSPRHTLGVGYSGETGNDNRSHALMGQWRMMF
ncbi:autotransporter domain-containing protein [Pseudomonas uvaldensis]|uniref:autotransporter domain-containing protein n=1 Tax=Pseudomonas uvaldensis TaxID=2878385 RepID=UPI001E63B549|nr:autotransporter domain-containing protein [Pseudomonas uvaldensis]MCE0462726.1 autotransporter domain-containing protein [Pseudomonas uvaldensis]